MTLLDRQPRLRVRVTGEPTVEVPVTQWGLHTVGPVQIDVDEHNGRVRWSVESSAEMPVALDAVGLVWDAGVAGAAPRLFSQGYQSWAPTKTLRLGVDEDASRVPGALAPVNAAFHADPGTAAHGELRSEQVAVLVRPDAAPECVGFTGGDRHAGTIRARVVGDRIEMCAEAWLGGARTGQPRALHDIVMTAGRDAATLLEEWATTVGQEASARVSAPFVTGWCSWYHYFERVTERVLRENLARAADWPFEVFQLDDGFQHAIGDWLAPNDRFPSGVEQLAVDIAAAGLTPGIWLAPFLAAPDSELTHTHPEWLAGAPNGDGFAIGMYNEPWGGVMAILDTTQPEVVDHLEQTAAALVAAGYRYLKLDFTFAAAMPGRYADPTRTPAQRVRAGFDAIRRGAGDETFLLGCGAPIGAVVGVVDGMRIGADVAPWWDPPPGKGEIMPGYEDTTPSTHNAFVNTCTRAFMHRRLWLNDPDCIMLRKADTDLTRAEAERWARTVGASGGLVVVSDDLALLDGRDRALLDEVIATGRASDAAAGGGRTPRVAGLLDPEGPVGL